MSIKVYRPVLGRIKVSGMPAPRIGEPTNREWFKDETGKAIRPYWVAGPNGWDGHWTIARQHFMTVARALALRTGSVEVIMDFNDLERCDKRCQEAAGDDCTCSCMGLHHRNGVYDGWVEVGESTLLKSKGRKRSRATLSKAQVLAGL